VRGGLKVWSYADPPQSLLQHRHWRLRRPDGSEGTYEVLQAHWDGHAMRVELEGVADRDAAAGLRDCEILIERVERPSAGPAQYYREDLEGFTVRNTEGALLGLLQYFLEAPAGALMVVKAADGRELWLPGTAPHLKRVDLARRELEIDWPADF
jgi:16S rRNA processing protein RimM